MDFIPGTADINFSTASSVKGQVINALKTATKTNNQVIDGFLKAPASSRPLKTNASRPPQPAAEGLHTRSQKAHTLMRGALKKPADGLNDRIQSLKPGINPQREFRARQTFMHSKVNRFGNLVAAAKATEKTNKEPLLHGEVINRTPTRIKQSKPASSAVALPSMITSASQQRLERMLDVALTRADSHKQALKYQAARHFWQKPGFFNRGRGIKLGVLAVLVLIAGLFMAWQKYPQLSVKVAGVKAHISASVPSYKPDGYSLAAPATTQAGAVLIKYKAPNQPQGFDLTQKQSEITSSGVAQSVVPQGATVQTSQVNGNTVYIYGASNDAAWVNNGILYKIKDHTKLSSDQILNIVKGLN